MGITCCNDTQELFLEIDECKNIEKIEYVIRSKAKDILIEIKEIIDYINDSKKIPKVIKVENIQKEYLEKRIEHIKEIQHCFIEAADLMSKKNYLNVIAVKEYMKEIIDLYAYIYDDTKKYVVSMLKFKDYVAKEVEEHNRLVDETQMSKMATPMMQTPAPDVPCPKRNDKQWVIDENGHQLARNKNQTLNENGNEVNNEIKNK